MASDTSEDVLTSATVGDVGGKRAMVMRSIRVPEKLWTAVREKADAEESDISTVIRELLERYLREKS